MRTLTPQQIAEVLSAPNKINKLTLKNRLVMAPAVVHGADKDGRPTEQTIAGAEGFAASPNTTTP